MAASRLPAPGTELGPCLPMAPEGRGAPLLPCVHVDCATTRRMAASPCKHCRKPIGYEVGFYLSQPPDVLSHALCEEKAVERDRFDSLKGGA